MDIQKQFEFLTKDYGLKYSYQDFHNCYDGYWWVCTHSYYNSSGCFTIVHLPQRNELDFYYAKQIGNTLESLHECTIDEQSVEPGIWAKAKKKFLFGYRNSLILETLAVVIQQQINKNGEFFGVKIVDGSDTPQVY